MISITRFLIESRRSGVLVAALATLVILTSKGETASRVGGMSVAGDRVARTICTVRLSPDTSAVFATSEGATILAVPGRLPVRSRIAGGGPSGAAVAAFVPAFRGAGAGVVAIGDPLAGSGGRVFLFFADGTLDSVPDLVLDGELPGDQFGASVAGVGDVDGDGFGDLVVGAPGRGGGAGCAYLFRGGSIPAISHAAHFDGTAVRDRFGAAAAGGADFNSDGHADFAVGAPGANGGVGEVAIIRGMNGVPSSVSQTISPDLAAAYANRPRFGASLAVGELTGDDFADLAVGAPGVSGGRGAMYVYRGIAGYLEIYVLALGEEPFGGAGSALVTGDFSGEGQTDLVVGAPGKNAGRGGVSVYLGGPSFNATADATDAGEARDDGFGSSLADGDMIPQAPVHQILIGAPLDDFNGLSRGMLYMFALPPAVDVEATAVALEVGGVPLSPGHYLDPTTRLRARLQSSAAVALARSVVLVDGRSCDLTATDDPGAIDIVLPEGLGDGAHRLSLTLAVAGGSVVAHFDITTFRNFELLAARLTPSPAHGPVEALFVMTRPGTYNVNVFDPSGRRVMGTGTRAGIAGQNRVDLPDLSSRANGIYFYRIEAAFAGRAATSQGRIVLLR